MSTTLVLTKTQTQGDVLGYNEQEDKEKAEESREADLIIFEDCSKGLGIKICGGCSINGEEDYGIFVKRVLPSGLADNDGRLQKGDQILEVNQESLEGVTNERAVAILRQASASNHVEMIIARDQQARDEFQEILERNSGYSYPSTPVPQEQGNTQVPSFLEQKSGRLSSASVRSHSSNSPVTVEPQADLSNEHENSAENVKNAQFNQEPHVSPSPTEPLVNGAMSSLRQQMLHGRLIPSMASTPNSRGSVGSMKPPSFSSGSSTLPLQEPSPVVGPSSLFQRSTVSSASVFDSRSMSRLPKSRNMSQSRKLSLDPHVRLKAEKLEMALRYLGIEPTEDQQGEMRARLPVDSSGTVNYGDFVDVARDVFRLQLEEKNVGRGAMFFAASDLTDLIDPPAFQHQANGISGETSEDYMSIKQERDQLRLENQRLKAQIREKEAAAFRAEEELLHIRKEAQGAIHESRTLRSQVHLAEQAQKAARDMENDYEEVVHLLEGEIANLKLQLAKKGDNSPAMQRRLAVLTCQLRKAEAGKKTFEVATEKLLQFSEYVHESLTSPTNGVGATSRPLSSSGEAARGGRPPGYLGNHKKQNTKSLATEAREVVKAVKSLINSQPLPFGWEEAYTADGMKYYINHLNQMTTWSHPMSGVHHLPTVQDDSKNRPPPDPNPPGATG